MNLSFSQFCFAFAFVGWLLLSRSQYAVSAGLGLAAFFNLSSAGLTVIYHHI